MNIEHAIFVYHEDGADRNVFETCIKTLRKVNDKCIIYVFNDDISLDTRKDGFVSFITKEYNVFWHSVEPKQMNDRRAVCKIDCFVDYIATLPLNDTHFVGVFDVDLYFLHDPFAVFYGSDFDVALTSRGYEYWCAINGGVFFTRITNERGMRVKGFWQEHKRQANYPTWDIYKKYQTNFGHDKFGQDWTRGQDYLNCVWNCVIDENELGFESMKIVDVTNHYNYCPACDYHGVEYAKTMLMFAYNNNKKAVLHLKSELKELIYENYFEDAVTRHERGATKWR